MDYDGGEGEEPYIDNRPPDILSKLCSIFHVRNKSSSLNNHKKEFEQSYKTEAKSPQKDYHPDELKSDRPNRSSISNSIKESNDLQKETNENSFNQCRFDKKDFPLINANINSKKERDKRREKQLSITDKRKEKRLNITDKLEETKILKKAEEMENIEKISKKETQYIGLKNQGATCYLNTILQTLFHIPAFRKLIFEIPFDIAYKNTQDQKNTQDSNENNVNASFDFGDHYSHQQHTTEINDQTNVILNLQALFAQLQTSKRSSISTRNLTKSFGWNYEQTQIQHDAQEFCIHLLDYIKSKLKNTPYSKAIDDLFMTNTRTYYKGINVDFEETSDDNFLVLSVVVKGFSTLNESLHSLLTTQYLKDGNQFESHKYGKQDVSLTTKFLKFPKVLIIHLKRFEFDINLNKNIKINSILMFKEELDISDFLSETDSEQQDLQSEYELHAVLVHDGFAEGGHYFPYIRPSTDPQWYRFNDSSVTAVDEFEAIDNNFGGPDLNKSSLFSLPMLNKDEPDERSFSAYMLVYVRKSSIDEIFCPIDNSIISEKVNNFLIEEKEKANRIQINIVDEKSLAMNALKGRISFHSSKKHVKKIYISNLFSTDEFYHSVASQLGIINYFFYLYKFEDDFLTDEISHSNDGSLIKSLQDGSSLFCSILDNNDQDRHDSILIFMFVYIRFLNHPLRYLTKTFVKSHWSILETLQKKIKMELNLSKPCQLSIFVKNGPVLTYIEEEKSKFDHYQSEMYVIDIFESSEMDDIIYEKGFLQDDEKKYSTRLINYFDYIDSMPKSSFDYFEAINDKSKMKLKTVEKFYSPIQIKFTNTCSFGEFLLFIRKALGINENQAINIYKSYEVLPIPQNENISRNNYQVLLNTKYLIVNVSNEIENDIALLEIIYSNDSINQKNRSPLLVRKELTVKDILEELKSGINELKSNKDATLRLLQLNEERNGQIRGITRVIENDEFICNLKNPLRVEPVPHDQIDVPSEDLIPVLFQDKNTQKTVNFLITIILDERFAETKKRIQSILNKDDDSMEMMTYYFISNGQRQSLKDDHIISNINPFNCQIKITQMMEPKMVTEEIKIYN